MSVSQCQSTLSSNNRAKDNNNNNKNKNSNGRRIWPKSPTSRCMSFLASLVSVAVLLLSLCCNESDAAATDTGNAVINNSNSMHTQIKSQNTHYTVKVGDTLVIPCEIVNRRQSTVIWQYSKGKIPETLTVGYFYYRKDFRIRVISNTSSDREQSWNLEIRKVRLDDEGYYLCKVMAEPDSLKRVVYLKVEIDMHMAVRANDLYHPNQAITLTCNTSYVPTSASTTLTSANEQLGRSKKANGTQHQSHSAGASHHHQHRLSWYKDGEYLAVDDTQQQQQQQPQSAAGTSSLSYKIEYHSKPTLWSSLHLQAVNPADLGVFTCKFRSQNVSTTLKHETAFSRILSEMGFSSAPKSSLQSVSHAAVFVFVATTLALFSALFH